MNARDQLILVSDWLDWQKVSLSDGLRHALDALRLYDYAQAHPELPEMADEWPAKSRVAALGYDPLEIKIVGIRQLPPCTGAALAARALLLSRNLIDSVAFVAQPGDTQPVIDAIDLVV